MKVARILPFALVAGLTLSSFVDSTPAQAQVGSEVRIMLAPPARRAETPYASPGADYVWQRGDWGYNAEHNDYAWHPGRWVLRPDAEHTVWFPGDWVNFGGSWHYVPGHWRTVAEGAPPDYGRLVDVVKEPPPLPPESVPAPVPGYGWDRGHWAWDGVTYRYVRGHWIHQPHELHAWEPGHWYSHEGRWFWHPGFWR